MNNIIENRFTQGFGLEAPIIQGPMGGISGPDLVAAVANAGALGILPIWADHIDEAISAIGKTQSLTDRPFGVNLRADFIPTDQISAAIDAGISIIHLFWGDPTPSMSAIRIGGARLIATVGDAQAAQVAIDAGASALIAQGVEAGGHVLSEMPIRELLDAVLAKSGDVPVIAAGGCANGTDGKHLMEHGASGVLYGTRFAVCQESDAHQRYKQAIIDAQENDTARSLCFDGLWPDAPHRTLVNSTYRKWREAGQPGEGSRPGEGEIVLRTPEDADVPRYSALPPKQGMTGEIEQAAMYAGTGVARITDCPTATQIIDRIAAELT